MRKQNLFFIMRINLISILLGLFTTQSFAQKINDNRYRQRSTVNPLIGVNVMEKEQPTGSITDMDGNTVFPQQVKKRSSYSLISDTYPKRFLLPTVKQSM